MVRPKTRNRGSDYYSTKFDINAVGAEAMPQSLRTNPYKSQVRDANNIKSGENNRTSNKNAKNLSNDLGAATANNATTANGGQFTHRMDASGVNPKPGDNLYNKYHITFGGDGGGDGHKANLTARRRAGGGVGGGAVSTGTGHVSNVQRATLASTLKQRQHMSTGGDLKRSRSKQKLTEIEKMEFENAMRGERREYAAAVAEFSNNLKHAGSRGKQHHAQQNQHYQHQKQQQHQTPYLDIDEEADEFFELIKGTVREAVHTTISESIDRNFAELRSKIDKFLTELNSTNTNLERCQEDLGKRIAHYGEENSKHFRYLCMKSEYDKMFYQHYAMLMNNRADGMPFPPAPMPDANMQTMPSGAAAQSKKDNLSPTGNSYVSGVSATSGTSQSSGGSTTSRPSKTLRNNKSMSQHNCMDCGMQPQLCRCKRCGDSRLSSSQHVSATPSAAIAAVIATINGKQADSESKHKRTSSTIEQASTSRKASSITEGYFQQIQSFCQKMKLDHLTMEPHSSGTIINASGNENGCIVAGAGGGSGNIKDMPKSAKRFEEALMIKKHLFQGEYDEEDDDDDGSIISSDDAQACENKSSRKKLKYASACSSGCITLRSGPTSRSCLSCIDGAGGDA